MLFRLQALADEGMWLPVFISRLNYVDMQKMGLHLTPEEIYSVNNSSLKDAIIIFDNGCTGEIISPDGLILTNHHCGYDAIQSHSSIDHDYLTNGFWAMNRAEELPNENLQVKFLVRIEDVTNKILSTVNDNMNEKERKSKIKDIISQIEKKAISDEDYYEAIVESFFEGNEYYLFVYKVYSDIRLVGAPPSSIGKFGGDTDNWMWPRHTGDFSLFRVYTNKSGEPAEYSKSNIPLKAKYFLPISLKGVKENDFAMILGYPGSTNRYMTSYGIKQELEQNLPNKIKIRTQILDILKKDMDENPIVRIKYASKYAETSNYWKNFIGQQRGLQRLKVYEKKKELENAFINWVNQSPERKLKYGEALDDIAYGYENNKLYVKFDDYFFEAIYLGSDVFSIAWKFKYFHDILKEENSNSQKIDKLVKYYSKEAEKYFKDFNAPTDKKLFVAMLKLFRDDIPQEMHPDIYKFIKKKYKGNIEKYADIVYKKSIFTDKTRMDKFLKSPSYKVIDNDMVYKAMNSFFDAYFKYNELSEDVNNKLERGKRLFIAGLREMQPDKKFYPDANFTMRLTYGKVLDYFPADAIKYNYYTTLKGVMEKEDPDNEEFIVPTKLKELYNKKDFGIYGEGNTLKVCFLTNNDITGGNSGSPVINGDGHLIGLAFDGNWEAMSGDIAFEPDLQRTINVDIRYVLFIIDKYAGASYLLDEMKIIK